jgi:hypothetical protein
MLTFINRLVNYGVLLLLGVVLLMAGSTTGVPIFPAYGRHQQQHAQKPLTTLRTPSATPPRINFLPHRSAQVLHYNLRRPSLHDAGSGVLHFVSNLKPVNIATGVFWC